jgi:spore coat-associated protein N
MKRTLTAVMLIGIVGMLAGASIHAYFSDVGASTGNTFAAGTLDLKVSDRDEGYVDGVTATWTASDMKPGTIIPPYSMSLQNWGTVAGDHIEISCSNVVTDPDGPESDTEEGTTDMDWVMEITIMTYNGNNLLDNLLDNNGNGIKDLDDFEAQGFDNLPPPLPNAQGSYSFTMALRFHPTLADNDYQGDILTTAITFTLNQDSSQ